MSCPSKAQLHKKWNAVRKETGYRSQFEVKIAEMLAGIEAPYEQHSIPYSLTTTCRYIPDWILPEQCIVLEAKGRFDDDDRRKMLLVKDQHPWLDIRILFQHGSTKLYKGCKTTYMQWAEKNAFPAATGCVVPTEWLEKKPTKEERERFETVFKL